MSESKTPLVAMLKKKLPAFALCLAIVGACLGALWNHYFGGSEQDVIGQMENRLLDLRFRLRGPRAPSNKIGILAIDDKSLEKFGRWPIARKHYERVFKNLKKMGASWVGFDVIWSEPERPLLEDVASNIQRLKRLTPRSWSSQAPTELKKIDAAMAASIGDRSLARAFTSYEQIVLGFIHFGTRQEAKSLGNAPFAGLEAMAPSAVIPEMVILPAGKTLADYKELTAYGVIANTDYIATHSENFAFFNNELSSDAIYRWVQLVRNIDGNLMQSLSLKLASKILDKEPLVIFDGVGVEDITLVNPEDDQDLLKIPVDLDGRGRLLLNHLGPTATIPHFSLADIYDGKLSPAQRKQIKGMSFILGPTAIGINDMRANPFDAAFDGVEQHAAAVDNIVSGTFMRRTESIYQTELLMVLAIGLLFSPLLVFGKAAFSGIAAVLFLVGYYFFDKFFWFGRGEWVYMGMPFIEIGSLFTFMTLYKYMTEEREKKKVKGAFGHYLSPEVMNQVLDDPSALKLGGEKKELTVFFSDVRSFTTISESLTPEKLGELMNEYFTPMAELILKSGGVLDKYIGDAIMAFWGAPLKIENQADIACQASLEMLIALDRLRVDLPQKGFPTIDIGIGLNTGTMSVGNFGSPQRFCYTVMGDAVNLGARLEGLTKEYGVKILISEFTRAKLTRQDLFTRDLDDIRVKGKLEPVKVFELMRPDIMKSESAIRSLADEFQGGRDAYRKQEWDKAQKHFMACLSLRPDDGPADLYLRRIEEYRAQPTMAEWDGVYTFKHK